ncbi:hypothetical protein NDI56_21265 [Haloarcula sp. S1CR25-12]|jgi:hypothetical protein|uniref:DUF1269 domain-containing protein n=1 Tax=Haloarcula saliterrae TaxID=2950534 RepID=A0ABU2FJC9_9EURY|nr:hypothetical protein [Haloarcula sp. S1CR25-12]MDS0261940.1 hypothetical protein [Haloarcula sp. S1CR25-12]
MRRVIARYDDPADATEAEEDLRKDGYDPERPDIENPFFDPSARPPEARGLLWGGLVGGVLGAILLLAMAMDMIWFPRLSPILSAGRLALVTFGFTIGIAIGGFIGGVWGLSKDVPEAEGPRVAVRVSDAEVDEVEDRLRMHDPTVVDDAVARHGG